MLRPSSLPHARAVLAAGLLGGVLAASGWLTPAPASALTRAATSGTSTGTSTATVTARVATSAAAQEQPLVPKIRSITPDYVPDKGPIVIKGTLTNDSHKKWTAINVHGFMGSTPLTTSAELAQAAQVPLTADVGHRITVPGTFASIASLAPGETTSFEIRLPHRTLPVSSPGVYWFGVHVLGNDGSAGPREAVGRDRTFLAYVPDSLAARGMEEDTSLVVPVRSGVVRGPDGTVVDPESWGRSLRSGPLHNVEAAGEAASGRPLTWLLDPAVPDVVRRLAHGNPARTLSAPAKGGHGNQSPSQSPSASTSSSGAGSSTSGPTDSTPSTATRRAAKHWLHTMHSLLASDTGQVLGLPYGDLAVDPATTYDLPLLRSAFHRSRRALNGWGVTADPVVAPPDGRTTPEAVSGLPKDTDVLLADTGVSGSAHTVDRVEGHRVVLSSTATSQGGPGPVNGHSSLAMRQRILAEAAVRLLGNQDPLVVELPAGLERRIRPSFFSGLDVPWLRLTTLGEASDVTPTRLPPDRLRPPPAQPTFGDHLYRTADGLLDSGDTLQSVLADNPSLGRRLFEEVTGNASYDAQREPYIALSRMRVIAGWVRQSLDDIDIAAPESVTLASASGHFSVLVSNDLDVPVTVKVRATTDSRLRITGGQTVKLGPHERASVLLNATTHQRGVHTVTVELASTSGQLLGAKDPFPLRAEQVSGLIWVIIGAGVALLFAAIAVRLTRRILRARAARRST